MGAEDFAERVADVAALADPTRRDLYLYVAAQAEPVSRDLASEGVGVPRHTAKFHLDRLVEQGLLDTVFQRLSGRRGPGAGRPTKLYRRSARQVAVSLPERRYDLAGQLMARAIDDSTRKGTAVVTELHAAADKFGRSLARNARTDMAAEPSAELCVGALCTILSNHGYEPRRHDRTITLANCPFHQLAQAHLELTCGMNLALIGGVVDGMNCEPLKARLDPEDGRCCVVLETS